MTHHSRGPPFRCFPSKLMLHGCNMTIYLTPSYTCICWSHGQPAFPVLPDIQNLLPHIQNPSTRAICRCHHTPAIKLGDAAQNLKANEGDSLSFTRTCAWGRYPDETMTRQETDDTLIASPQI